MLRRSVARCAAGSALAKQIQELRYKTDAPILQCKKALGECDGDIEKAIAWLRAKGAADSVKKEGRETAFGTLGVCVAKPGAATRSDLATPAAIIELGAETDFAVRNEKFAAFANELCGSMAEVIGQEEHAGRSDAELLEILQTRSTDAKKALIAALGENVVLKRVWAMPAPEAGLAPRYADDGVAQPTRFVLGSYVHNSSAAAPLVGNIIGLAGCWSYKADGALERADVDDFAQHLVSHLGDKSDVAGQAFLGSDQTVSKWCKERACRLRAGFVYKYGMEAPQLVVPKPIEAPKV
uniref:Elongation factor Ts, mitochondrial n=1 Tax=Neobodo designis TaxID=312471 RepID=A0A7S1QFW8_NEODS|mmetsp:Transcript_41860/g.129368  ORF Transcript_41860/g.129368 Transcript_41860/m.129368 type:complete len:296 (+) Transcript_41860:55-942(+)